MNASTSLRATLTHLVQSDKTSIDEITIRQMAIMLVCYEEPTPCTVRGMAAKLDVTKPSVTRAFQRLEILGLLKRQTDPADKRSILAIRTKKGEKLIASLDKIAAAPVVKSIPVPAGPSMTMAAAA